MGITQLIDDYYVTAGLSTNASLLRVGQFGWAPVPHTTGAPHIIDGIRAEATDHRWFAGSLRRVREDDYRQRKELPIKLMGLRAGERLLVARSKRRPCVILAIKHATEHLDEGPPHLRRTTLLVAPSFHAQTWEEDNGIPPEWMARIKALMYPWFFPLKAKRGAPTIEEGVLLEQSRTLLGGQLSPKMAEFKEVCESCLP